MKYKILKKLTLFQGFFKFEGFTVQHDTFKGGSLIIERELMERGDAVAILLYDKHCDEVLLIEQFRIAPAVREDNAWMIEVVAGMLDEGEDKVQCAIRESIEEAGYEPFDIQLLGKTYASPGGTSECLYMYLGYVDKNKPVSEGGGLDEEHEDIRSFWVSREEAVKMVQDGRINSSVPMLTVMLSFGIHGVIPCKK
ncbi:MAG: NUDIX domain-containing protein [Ghiorsea sp.]|nr:NUDIX domain-containing protein [Ghiorsea sp.]